MFGPQQEHMDMLEGLNAPTDLSTLILIQGDDYYLYSAAAFRTLALMDQPYRSLSFLSIIPPLITDQIYKFVAANRYDVFGKTEDVCRAPSPEFNSRFLGYDPSQDDSHTDSFLQQVVKDI